MSKKFLRYGRSNFQISKFTLEKDRQKREKYAQKEVEIKNSNDVEGLGEGLAGSLKALQRTDLPWAENISLGN